MHRKRFRWTFADNLYMLFLYRVRFIIDHKTNQNHRELMVSKRLKLLLNKRFLLPILICLAANLSITDSNASDDPKDKVSVVVLDAGHGGHDPGALGKRSREKNIVLSITLLVGKYIEENIPDVKVIYTRDKDVFIPLHERADIANKNHADLFISIHANWWSNPRSRGAETYAMGTSADARNRQVAMKAEGLSVHS